MLLTLESSLQPLELFFIFVFQCICMHVRAIRCLTFYMGALVQILFLSFLHEQFSEILLVKCGS